MNRRHVRDEADPGPFWSWSFNAGKRYGQKHFIEVGRIYEAVKRGMEDESELDVYLGEVSRWPDLPPFVHCPAPAPEHPKFCILCSHRVGYTVPADWETIRLWTGINRGTRVHACRDCTKNGERVLETLLGCLSQHPVHGGIDSYFKYPAGGATYAIVESEFKCQFVRITLHFGGFFFAAAAFGQLERDRYFGVYSDDAIEAFRMNQTPRRVRALDFIDPAFYESFPFELGSIPKGSIGSAGDSSQS